MNDNDSTRTMVAIIDGQKVIELRNEEVKLMVRTLSGCIRDLTTRIENFDGTKTNAKMELTGESRSRTALECDLMRLKYIVVMLTQNN